MDYILEQLEYSDVKEDFVIPESCNTFYKKSLYLSEYCHRLFDELLEEIGVDELKQFELNGSRVVYEGANLDKIKDKFESVLTRIYRAIDSFWNSVLLVFNKGEKATYVPIKQETIDALDPNKIYGKTHTFFKDADAKFGANANEFIRNVNKAYKDLISSNADSDTISKMSKKFEAMICSKVSGIESISKTKELTKQLKSKLTGEEVQITKATIEKYNDIIYKIGTSKESFQRAQKAYEDQKKVFWNLIDKIEKDFSDEFVSIVSEWTKVIVDTVSILNTCYGIQCDVMTRRRQEYRNILAKLNSIQNKLEKATK
jgi:hypothetical protein